MFIHKYEDNFLEPELKPAFVEKIRKIEKRSKFHNYKNLNDLRREIENT